MFRYNSCGAVGIIKVKADMKGRTPLKSFWREMGAIMLWEVAAVTLTGITVKIFGDKGTSEGSTTANTNLPQRYSPMGERDFDYLINLTVD